MEKSTHKFKSVVKTSKPMFLTQKPKFPTARDLKNISQKIISRKNNFPQNNSFFTPMVHIRKPTTMGFPENRQKMPQLHGPITFSKMVVRGWYMPHFYRTDLPTSKKQVWSGFRNLSDLYGPNCDFFGNFDLGRGFSKNNFFDFRVRKNDRK